MTVSEMLKVYNMNMDQFKSYALKKGYTMPNTVTDEEHTSTSYQIGKGDKSNVLQYTFEYNNSNNLLSYYTSDINEIYSIKKQLKLLSFSLLRGNPSDTPLNVFYGNAKYFIFLRAIEGYEYAFLIGISKR